MKLNLLFITTIFAVLSSQYLLPRILKIQPFSAIFENTGKLKSSLIFGLAVIIIIIPASITTFIINRYLLLQYNITYLRIITLIAIAALFAYAVKTIIKKILPAILKSHDLFLTYLMIISAELCLVTGLLNIEAGFIADMEPAALLIQGIAAGFAFTIVLLLITGILDRLEFAEVHPNLKGIPIALLAACLLALAFFSFPQIKI
jgi:Na+-translocating ferredoxin:NAD+ oxidoreductase subunit A